jgi:hypothetical protein
MSGTERERGEEEHPEKPKDQPSKEWSDDNPPPQPPK